MSISTHDARPACHPVFDDWQALATRVLDGHKLTREEGAAVLRCPDDQLLDLLSAAYRVRRRFFGKRVQLYFLINAKSGLCPEDCAYCSQSKVATSEIPRYNLLSSEKLLAGAEAAYRRHATTYCIVISARGPNRREIETICTTVPQIKAKFGLKVCTSLGLLTADQAQQLKTCGVDRVNHNVNTSEHFYAEICGTHTYQDRIQTLHAARQAGLELCSGGIIGLGEKPEDVVQMALALQELHVHSIPINFLISIEGTPLQNNRELNPRYCLKVLALLRLSNPESELRIAGGRELHLGSMQCLGLYPANSIFVGDYLTTKGQLPEADYRMIKEMGFEIEVRGGSV
jgi:biotin synthase